MPEGWVEKYLMRKDVNPNTDSVLWNAMIHPILQMRFKGATWYQGLLSKKRNKKRSLLKHFTKGESNQLEPTAYGCRFPGFFSFFSLFDQSMRKSFKSFQIAMISDWRAKFNSTLPFHFVQLAGFFSLLIFCLLFKNCFLVANMTTLSSEKIKFFLVPFSLTLSPF